MLQLPYTQLDTSSEQNTIIDQKIKQDSEKRITIDQILNCKIIMENS